MAEILFSKAQSLVLDLTYAENSDIGYKVNKFPDGQKSIEIFGPMPQERVTIKSRCMWEDLELIVAAKAFITSIFSGNTVLVITYLGGGRCDRQFNENQGIYLRDVIAPVINSCNFSNVVLIDPHSYVSAAAIKNSVVRTNYELVKPVLGEYLSSTKCLIVPDQGAYAKSHLIESLFDKVVCCTKTRDPKDGKPTVKVPKNEIEYTDMCFVVDDICDGGNTFLRIGEQLGFLETKPELIVSHGIFSGGVEELLKIYGKIHTTDSYQRPLDVKNVETYKIMV